jgi:hypothetical protein
VGTDGNDTFGFHRRERPHLMLNSDGDPSYLTNGVAPFAPGTPGRKAYGDWAYTAVFPICLERVVGQVCRPQHLLKTDDADHAAVVVSASHEQLPSLTKTLQHYNSGLVTMARMQRDAHLLRLAGASHLRVDVGLGWGTGGDHMPGIFGDVIRGFSLESFDPSPILQLSRLLNESGVVPIYSWCYNPFASDFTQPQSSAANLTTWRQLHRHIARALSSAGLPAIHELYNVSDVHATAA